MNDRLDRILTRGGRPEAIRDALRLLENAVADPQPLTDEERDVAREIRFVIDQLVWGSLRAAL